MSNETFDRDFSERRLPQVLREDPDEVASRTPNKHLLGEVEDTWRQATRSTRAADTAPRRSRSRRLSWSLPWIGAEQVPRQPRSRRVPPTGVPNSRVVAGTRSTRSRASSSVSQALERPDDN